MNLEITLQFFAHMQNLISWHFFCLALTSQFPMITCMCLTNYSFPPHSTISLGSVKFACSKFFWWFLNSCCLAGYCYEPWNVIFPKNLWSIADVFLFRKHIADRNQSWWRYAAMLLHIQFTFILCLIMPISRIDGSKRNQTLTRQYLQK